MHVHVHVHEKTDRRSYELLADRGLYGISEYMDHEKLDVYRVSLDVVRIVNELVKNRRHGNRVIRDQITRSSISVVLNIAEGTGKRSSADRRRFYEIARGSAMETAAALDIMQALGYANQQSLTECKMLLRRVVAMLTRMTVVAANSVSEEEAVYGVEPV